jgi:xanthine dehydrogenase YagS FAD-binding subunit
MSRATWGFPLAGVAISLRKEGTRIADARVALSGLAPIPIRAPKAEQALAGQEIRTLDVEKVAEAALDGARPLAENTYKVELLRGLVKQALDELLAA